MKRDRKEYMRKWRAKNPDKVKNIRMKGRYGITLKEYDTIFKEAPLCEICFTRPSECLDHNHETGNIRGVLCNVCNQGLGKLGDTKETLYRAYTYLKERD